MKNRFIVLAEVTSFGSIGEMSFCFITDLLILSLGRVPERKSEFFFFRSPSGCWFPHRERMKFFSSIDNARRWIDTHSVSFDGKTVRLIAVPYSFI